MDASFCAENNSNSNNKSGQIVLIGNSQIIFQLPGSLWRIVSVKLYFALLIQNNFRPGDSTTSTEPKIIHFLEEFSISRYNDRFTCTRTSKLYFFQSHSDFPLIWHCIPVNCSLNKMATGSSSHTPKPYPLGCHIINLTHANIPPTKHPDDIRSWFALFLLLSFSDSRKCHSSIFRMFSYTHLLCDGDIFPLMKGIR